MLSRVETLIVHKMKRVGTFFVADEIIWEIRQFEVELRIN